MKDKEEEIEGYIFGVKAKLHGIHHYFKIFCILGFNKSRIIKKVDFAILGPQTMRKYSQYWQNTEGKMTSDTEVADRHMEVF